jgi:tRNA(Ile)-lysidine synthase
VLGILRSENPSAQLDLPGGLSLTREYDRCLLSKGHPKDVETEFVVQVDGPGTVLLPGNPVILSFVILPDTTQSPDATDGRKTALFDADRIPFPLTVRTPMPGDRFHPWSMEGSRKLKDMFIDLKVPRRKRNSIPLVVKEDRILWIPAIRRSNEAPVTRSTKRVLQMTLVEPWEE